jgi:hypothetical protein
MDAPAPDDPEIAAAAATLAAFVARTGAQAAIALVDRGEAASPAMIECTPGSAPVVTIEAHAWSLDVAAAAPEPLPLPAGLDRMRRLPALEVDAAAGEIAAPLGAVAALGEAVRDLAAVLSGRGVATARFATTDPTAPLTVAARRGEPLVLALGEEQFQMPDGWP